MSVTSPPQRRADARARSREPEVPQTRRTLRHGSSAHRRRMHRLRRSVFVAITALLFGTVVARVTQDPAVALPRPAVVSSSRVVALDPAATSTGAAGASARRVAGAAPTAAHSESEASSSTGAQSPSVGAAADATPPAAGRAAPTTASPGDAEEGVAEPVVTPGATVVEVPQSAAGTLHLVGIPQLPARSTGRTIRFAIEIEDGLTIPDAEFAAAVARVLVDDRGWQAADGVHFVAVSPAEVAAGAHTDIRVVLATPTLTAKLCAPLDTAMAQVSCWNGSRAVLNLQRWLRGAATYGEDLESYRTYLVNHEVGHGLGHRHAQCPTAGSPAPIMVQQTKSLDGCTAWPWPTRP